MVQENNEYRILPISDIIRAIPTPNLVCAFITLSSASAEQEAKMVGYARAVGMMLDETLAERPTKVVDTKTAKTFEWFFDDFVDGGLLRKYQIGTKKVPKHFKCLIKAFPDSQASGTFFLNQMISVLENSGVSENDAYLLTMQAIEDEFILPVYLFNNSVESGTE